MSGLPRMYTETIVQQAMLDDTGIDLDSFDAYLREHHVERLAAKGYAPEGEIEVRRPEQSPFFAARPPWRPIWTVSETRVSWRAEA